MIETNGIAPLDMEVIVEEVKKKKKAPVRKAPVRMEGGWAILDNYFRMEEGTYKILRRNMKKGVSSLLLGQTGVGKTELVTALAATEGLPLTIFDMGTMADPIMSLVGTHAIKVREGRTESRFVRSRFSEVIQEPGVVLMDEISRSPAQANNLLFPVLDFRRELSMEYSFDNHKPVKVHPKCVFFATANLGSQYTGTHKLDRALIDRFMMIEVDALSKEQVAQIVEYHYTKLNGTQVSKIVNCFMGINKLYEEYTIPFSLSVRHLKMVSELVQDGFTIYDSYYAICKGIGSKEGLESLKSILNALQ